MNKLNKITEQASSKNINNDLQKELTDAVRAGNKMRRAMWIVMPVFIIAMIIFFYFIRK